jgi:DNA-binding HxlR family transcriptional regulator
MHKRSNKGIFFCPLQDVFGIISKKWALQVVNEIGNHKRIRFTILKEELRYVTPTVLSNTLNTLESKGLILRCVFKEIPPRVEYSLTDDGRQLYNIIVHLIRWASSRDNAEIRKCSCNALAEYKQNID